MNIDAGKREQIKAGYLKAVADISQEDVGSAHRKGHRKIETLEAKGIPEALAGLWKVIKLMIAMLGDVLFRRYTGVPWKTIAAIVAAILYFVLPVDLIPDFIPVIGYVDDAMVIALALELVRDDLEIYRLWSQEKDEVVG